MDAHQTGRLTPNMFQSAPPRRERSDVQDTESVVSIPRRFNPRPREGSDVFDARRVLPQTRHRDVSIRAPAKGAI